jgi:hypothetical protein
MEESGEGERSAVILMTSQQTPLSDLFDFFRQMSS